MRLGYALEDEVPESAETVAAEDTIAQKLYWVGWGWHPIYDELLEPEKPPLENKEKYPEIDVSSSALPADILKALINQLRDEMIRSTPPTLLEGKIIRPFVFGYITTIFIPSGSPENFPVDGGDGGSETVKPRFEVRSAGCLPCNCPPRNPTRRWKPGEGCSGDCC